MFIDRVVVRVTAGTGGSGASSFRREKFVPMGGPDGGDGGKGGDVIVRGDGNLSTLLDYTYRDQWTAERGEHGQGSNRTGRSGKDVILPVPPGTVVRDADTGERLGEVLGDGEELVIAKGGRGGKGNAFFATATKQAPREWQPGEEGEARTVEFELKLIADVGLVGKPNAGKSTLLSVISKARPKIADYPFTTLSPNLGVVPLSDHRTFVVADIPGIIEGAHEGKGLGLQFLRHIERTRLLAFLVPIDVEDWQAEYDALRAEIAAYSPALAAKPHCLVFTKCDLLGELWTPDVDAPDAFARFAISAAGRQGLEPLLDAWWKELQRLRQAEPAPAAPAADDDWLAVVDDDIVPADADGDGDDAP
jgi:GTP-binding protein